MNENSPYKRILVANRGEIALRIIRTCRENDIETIAVYSREDSGSAHVEFADNACCIGEGHPSASYMNIPSIISAALLFGAEAVHPGYGFLAEDDRFAKILRAHGISFIGPEADALLLAKDKLISRKTALSVNVPVLPGSGEISASNFLDEAEKIGYPLVIKPRVGGAGRGIIEVWSKEELLSVLTNPAFDTDVLGSYYLERKLGKARHIEAQVLADRFGVAKVIGIRDCSIQKGRQKIIEESPPAHLGKTMRKRIEDASLELCSSMGLSTAVTFEFLVSGNDFFFIEVNPRIQVEHTVTEMLTGIDIVWEQIKLSAGERLDLAGEEYLYDKRQNYDDGHAIQARIYVEPDFSSGSCGLIGSLRIPGGPGVRFDTHLYPGCAVPYLYDPLVAKVIAWGSNRVEAIRRMRRALEEVRIEGVMTNIEVLKGIVESKEFRHAKHDIGFAEEFNFCSKEAGEQKEAIKGMKACEMFSV